MKISIEFYIFELIQVLNYSFNKEFWDMEQIFKKGHLRSKTEKINITIELFVLKLVFASIFSSNQQFLFLDQIFPKRVAQKWYFQSKPEKMDTII